MLKVKKIYRYSESFKQQVLLELSKGIYSANEIRKRYGIKGTVTISNWSKISGNFGLIHQIRFAWKHPKKKIR